MKNFEERSDALTGSACLKKAVGDQHQGNSTTWGQAIIRSYCQVGNFQRAQARNSGIPISGIDGQVRRCRTKIGYIGENGLEPNQPYTLNEHGIFVPVVVARGGVQ